MATDLASLREWADSSCGGLSDATSSLFALPLESATRSDKLTSAVQAHLPTALSDPENLASAELNADFRPYFIDLGLFELGSAALVAIVLILSLPLFVSRCCAHRCCTLPSRCCGSDPPSRVRKASSCCCLNLFALLIFGSAALGGMGGHQLDLGLRQTMCAADGAYRNASSSLSCADAAAASIEAEATAVLLDLDAAVASLGCLTAAFDATTGSITLACAATVSALAAVDGVEAALVGTEAGSGDYGSGGLTLPSDLSAVKSTLVDQQELLCTTLPAEAAPEAQQYASDLGSLRSSLELVAGGDSSLASSLDLPGRLAAADAAELDLLEAFQTMLNVLGEAVDGAPPMLGVGSGGGAAPFALPALFVLLSGLGALCMCASRNKDGRCNGVGVQAAGCGWVLLWSYALLLGLLPGLALAALATDAGVLLMAAPADPATTLGAAACAEMRVAVGDGGETLDACALLEGCWATPPTPLLDALHSQLDLPSAASLRDDLATFGLAALGAATSAAQLDSELGSTDLAAAAAALGGGAACALTAAGLGLQPTDAGYAAATAQLGVLCAATADAASNVTAADSCAATAATTLSPLLSSSYADALLAALEGLEPCLSCEGWAEQYEAVVSPLTSGVGRDGLAMIALALLACGASSLAFAGCAIASQVHLGRVDRQPGCPRPCRCCCPRKKAGGRRGLGSALVAPNVRIAPYASRPSSGDKEGDEPTAGSLTEVTELGSPLEAESLRDDDDEDE